VVGFRCGKVENLGGRMRRMKKRGPHVLYDLNDLLFSLQMYRVGQNFTHQHIDSVCHLLVTYSICGRLVTKAKDSSLNTI